MNESNGYRLISQPLLVETSTRASKAPRKRTNHNFHQLEDRVQRMLNAMEPGTYVQPHRHLNPPKVECFLLLRGRVTVLFFNESGTLTDCFELDGKKNFGVDISAGVWHALVCTAPGTVLFETKDGPYDPSTDKEFADWAPAETDPVAATAYLEQMLDLSKKMLKQKIYRGR